jgi:hypothetical protein
MHKKGRPVLVGTTSVEKSELVGRLLDDAGIPYEVPYRTAVLGLLRSLLGLGFRC